MNDEFIDMCDNMADMLRYISKGDEDDVSLEREIHHTRNYLTCICARLRNKLSYQIDIDDSMLEIPVPKLIIQLLVENAVKYGTNTLPPWQIEITGCSDQQGWRLTVYDNGAGFDQEVLDKLGEKIAHIQRTKEIPALEIDGMGLMNLFIRLYLQYKEKTIFFIRNDPRGGASITVGKME